MSLVDAVNNPKLWGAMYGAQIQKDEKDNGFWQHETPETLLPTKWMIDTIWYNGAYKELMNYLYATYNKVNKFFSDLEIDTKNWKEHRLQIFTDGNDYQPVQNCHFVDGNYVGQAMIVSFNDVSNGYIEQASKMCNQYMQTHITGLGIMSILKTVKIDKTKINLFDFMKIICKIAQINSRKPKGIYFSRKGKSTKFQTIIPKK